MAMGREEAIERGIRFFAERGATVVRSVAGSVAGTARVAGSARLRPCSHQTQESVDRGVRPDLRDSHGSAVG